MMLRRVSRRAAILGFAIVTVCMTAGCNENAVAQATATSFFTSVATSTVATIFSLAFPG